MSDGELTLASSLRALAQCVDLSDSVYRLFKGRFPPITETQISNKLYRFILICILKVFTEGFVQIIFLVLYLKECKCVYFCLLTVFLWSDK